MKTVEEYLTMSDAEKKSIVAKIENWLNHGAMAVLKPLMLSYLGKFSHVVKQLLLLVSDISCTNNKSVIVSVTEKEACTMNKDTLMRILKFKLYHELSHVLYTDDTQYIHAIDAMCNVLELEASKINKVFIRKHIFELMADILNSIEDGRIENILCRNYKGAKKHRDWYRLNDWSEFKMSEDTSKYVDIRNSILMIATIGLFPNGFAIKYPSSGNIYKLVRGLIYPISKYVSSNTVADGEKYAIQIAQMISPYIINDYAMSEEEYRDMQTKTRSKYSLEELQEIAERVARDSQNIRNSPSMPDGDIPQNGPIVSVLTDDDDMSDDVKSNQTPDVVVDLRKNPEMQEEKGEDNQDSPYYYRPEELDNHDSIPQTETEKNNSQATANGTEENNSQTEANGTGENNSQTEANGTEENNSQTEANGTEENNSQTEANGTEENNSQSDASGTGENNSQSEASGTGENNSQTDASGTGESNSQSEASGTEENNSQSEASGTGENYSQTDASGTGESNSQSDASGLNGNLQIESNDTGGNNSLSENAAELISNMVNQALDSLKEKSEMEIRNDIKRANREEKSWAMNDSDAQPLDSSVISDLTNDFGGQEIKVIDYRNRKTKSCPSDIKQRAKNLAKKLQNIILTKQVKDRKNCLYGGIDSQNLGKFITGQPDFYKQDGSRKNTDLACLIMKDDSGSMAGENENKALEVLAELEECFKILKFPLRIQTFSSRYEEMMKIIKSWNDVNQTCSYTYSFAQYSTPSGCNNDAYSIALATDILCQRREKNKLLIVVSDGAPCCSTELVERAVQRARKKGVFVISILIGSESEVRYNWNTFVSMYKSNLLAGSLDNMGNQMFKFIKKFISSIS